MKARTRHALLGGALAFTLVATLMAPEPEHSVVAVAASAASPGTGASAPARTPEEILGIKPRDQMDDPQLAFSTRQWNPRVKRVERAVPAKRAEPVTVAKAPPLPFRAMGQYVEDGEPVVFLQFKEKALIVKQGDVVETDYRVERIDDGKITFTYLPLAESQTLALGEAP